MPKTSKAVSQGSLFAAASGKGLWQHKLCKSHISVSKGWLAAPAVEQDQLLLVQKAPDSSHSDNDGMTLSLPRNLTHQLK